MTRVEVRHGDLVLQPGVPQIGPLWRRKRNLLRQIGDGVDVRPQPDVIRATDGLLECLLGIVNLAQIQLCKQPAGDVKTADVRCGQGDVHQRIALVDFGRRESLDGPPYLVFDRNPRWCRETLADGIVEGVSPVTTQVLTTRGSTAPAGALSPPSPTKLKPTIMARATENMFDRLCISPYLPCISGRNIHRHVHTLDPDLDIETSPKGPQTRLCQML